MPRRPVQSVFFWPADMATPFRAVYGRVRGSSKYSKSFHQVAEPAAIAMERAFGIGRRASTPVTFVWPQGERSGSSHFDAASADDSRSRLHWPRSESPDPWRLAPQVGPHTLQVITGQPGVIPPSGQMDPGVEAIAEAEFLSVQTADERPWYLAVHLQGDGPILHVRAVLENPAPGHEFASWENLPLAVREAMRATRRRGDATGFKEFEEGVALRAGKTVNQILAAFHDNPNVLLVGPPGCGKTVAMEDLRRVYEEGAETVLFDTDAFHGAFSEDRQSFDASMRKAPRRSSSTPMRSTGLSQRIGRASLARLAYAAWCSTPRTHTRTS